MAVHAQGFQFEHNGKTYYIPRVTLGDRRRWQLWANAKALSEARANQQAVDAGWMSESDAAELVETVKRNIVAGRYHPQEEDGRLLMATEDGYIEFVSIVMRRADTSMTSAAVRALIESIGPSAFLEYWRLAQESPLAERPVGREAAGCDTSTASTSIAG